MENHTTEQAESARIRVGLVGLGKMGISHLSMINALPDVDVVGVCDSTGYVLDVLGKYTGLTTYPDHTTMLREAKMDAVIIATPSRYHAPMVQDCLDAGLHVFCEKPFCLDPRDSNRLAASALERNLVTQVGYHNRHVGAFQEAKRLLDSNAIGTVTHVLAEAYGPVVLKPKGSTWRSRRVEGGGALYDYAAHPADLLTWYFGKPASVSGSVLGQVFSAETEDEVFSTIHWPSGMHSQLSVSWSDESQRKMTTKVTIWGTNGRINVDRQEIQVYLRDAATPPEGYQHGWNVHYTTELTEPVEFYVRGEEYTAQLEAWVGRIQRKEIRGSGDFVDAAITDDLLAAIVRSTSLTPEPIDQADPDAPAVPARRIGRFRRAWRAARAAWKGEASR